MSHKEKLKLLFLCTGNSCRSQMAEGFARALRGESIEAYSAGIRAHGLNARAVQVMAEVGIDISGHSSKTVADLPEVRFDYVVTVCGNAHDHCPTFAGDAQAVSLAPKLVPLLDDSVMDVRVRACQTLLVFDRSSRQ